MGSLLYRYRVAILEIIISLLRKVHYVMDLSLSEIHRARKESSNTKGSISVSFL